MDSRLIDKRAAGKWIIKCEHLLDMRSTCCKPAGKPQGSDEGGVTQNQPGGIVTQMAETQQLLSVRLRQIEFAAEYMMERLPKRNLKELRGRTQLLP